MKDIDLTINNEKFVVFDIETTGLNVLQGDEIIQISALKVEKNKIIDSFSEYVKPKQKIKPNIASLTGITNETVRNSRGINLVLKEFLDFVGNEIVVAHNGIFDVGFIEYFSVELFNKSFDNKLVDTLVLARYLYPNLKHHKLNNICDFLNVVQIQHHNADDDTKVLCECFFIMANQLRIRFKKEIFETTLFKIKKIHKYNDIICFQTNIGILKYNIKQKKWYKDKDFATNPKTKNLKLEEIFPIILEESGTKCQSITELLNKFIY